MQARRSDVLPGPVHDWANVEANSKFTLGYLGRDDPRGIA